MSCNHTQLSTGLSHVRQPSSHPAGAPRVFPQLLLWVRASRLGPASLPTPPPGSHPSQPACLTFRGDGCSGPPGALLQSPGETPCRAGWRWGFSCLPGALGHALGLLVAQGPSDPGAVGEDLRLITPHRRSGTLWVCPRPEGSGFPCPLLTWVEVGRGWAVMVGECGGASDFTRGSSPPLLLLSGSHGAPPLPPVRASSRLPEGQSCPRPRRFSRCQPGGLLPCRGALCDHGLPLLPPAWHLRPFARGPHLADMQVRGGGGVGLLLWLPASSSPPWPQGVPTSPLTCATSHTPS